MHLVGHGWGGVVAVAAASHPDLLKTLLQRECRVVTLGAPFTGSWEVQRMLDGAHPLAKMLAAVLTRPAKTDTVGPVLAGWPGLKECLPNGSHASVPAEVLPLLRRWRALVCRPA